LSEQQQDASPVLLDTLQRVQDTLAAQLDQLMSGVAVTPAKAEIARLKRWLVSKDDADLLLTAPSVKKTSSKVEVVDPEQHFNQESALSAEQHLASDDALDLAKVEPVADHHEDKSEESAVADELVEDQQATEENQSAQTDDSSELEDSSEDRQSILEQTPPEVSEDPSETLSAPAEASQAAHDISDEADGQDSAQRLANRSIFQIALETQADFDDLSEQDFEQLVSLE